MDGGSVFRLDASAATFTYNNDDDNSNTFYGFNATLAANSRWSSGAGATSGNDYVNTGFIIRTLNANASYTFPGDTLSLVDGARFFMRNTTTAGNSDTVNFNSLKKLGLLLDGAEIRNCSANSIELVVAGAIEIGPNGALFMPDGGNFNMSAGNISANQTNNNNNYLRITANITNPDSTNSVFPGLSGGGAVALGGNDTSGGGAVNMRVVLAPTTANTYSGPTYLLGGNVQLGNANALPSTSTLYLGTANSSNGSAVLDLNGQSISVAGIAVQSYSSNPSLTNVSFTAPAGFGNRTFRLNGTGLGIKIGQTATTVGLATASTQMVATVYENTIGGYTDVTFGDNNTAFSNATAGLSGLTFNSSGPIAANQTIGNGSNTDATLTITSTSSFAGNIVDGIAADPNVPGTVGTGKTNIQFAANGGTLTLSGANTYSGNTVLSGANSTLVLNYAGNTTYGGVISGLTGSLTKGSSGTLALTGANTYGGTTTVSGGGLTLDFSAAAAPASNIINNAANTSSLKLSGSAILTLNGSATAANSQQFNGLTLATGAAGTIRLTTNAAPQALALNVGAITRQQGSLLFLNNPSGTLSVTNGLQTTTGSAGALIATSGGTPYVILNGTDWGAKDVSNHFVAAAAYTNSTANSLSGNANVVTDTTLTPGATTSSVRFNDSSDHTITIAGGTLTTGGVLETANVLNHASTITGGSIRAAGANEDLVLVQNNPANVLSVASNIINNGTSNLVTAGSGKIVLSGQNSYSGKTTVAGGTLQFTKEQSLYNNTSASWTADNITVNAGATLSLNVGGSALGEFTSSDVATISALGTATGGFQSGSALGLDTTNADGGVFTLANTLTNTNSGANSLGLTKSGPNILQLAAGDNSYSGPTAINQGTVQLQSGTTFSGGSVVTIANEASATLDINGNTAAIGGLSGGGSTGGTVSMGSGGNLTIGGSANATYGGSITGTGPIAFNLSAAGTTQTMSGAGYAGGNLTFGNGTVLLAPAGGTTTWGSSASPLNIAPNAGNNATVTVGAGATLTASNVAIGSNGIFGTTGGVGVLNVNTATSVVNAASLNFGTFSGTNAGQNSTFNLSNGTVSLSGAGLGGFGQGNGAINVSLAIVMVPNNNETATINVSGGALNINNSSSIVMGQFFGRTATINQSGGNITFYSDAGTSVGGTGGLYFDNNNSTSGQGGVYTYNLTGGTLTVPQIVNAGPSGTSTGVLNLNGGILAAAADTGNFISGTPVAPLFASGLMRVMAARSSTPMGIASPSVPPCCIIPRWQPELPMMDLRSKVLVF